MKNITRILSAALALCLLAALCLPARADGTQDCGAKLLAITFDDGPGKYTGALLDGLAERGVHATFFVNGVNASGWPETLKRIVNEGHQLANHTYNHKNLNTCSAQTVAYEISAVQALITAAGGDENAYIRAPYGNANKTVKSVVTAPLIYWSVDPEDWKYRNAETVRSNIESGVFDGAIILVHDIYKTSVDGALAAIDDLLAEGYEFVTVQDLLLRRGVTPEAATVYYSAKNNGINLPADAVGEQAFDESRIETHWGYAAMKTCLDYGWMMLTDTGEWKPNAFVTRAEFAADLARFAGIHTLYPLEGAARFSDVDLTAEDARSFNYQDSYTGAELKAALLEAAGDPDVEAPPIKEIDEWLLAQRLIGMERLPTKGFYYVPTPAGVDAGLRSEDKVSARGTPYSVLLFTPEAQRMVAEHFIKPD